jgi:hypothetical protein
MSTIFQCVHMLVLILMLSSIDQKKKMKINTYLEEFAGVIKPITEQLDTFLHFFDEFEAEGVHFNVSVSFNLSLFSAKRYFTTLMLIEETACLLDRR